MKSCKQKSNQGKKWETDRDTEAHSFAPLEISQNTVGLKCKERKYVNKMKIKMGLKQKVLSSHYE